VAADVFNTRSQVTAGPATPLLNDAADPCRLKPLPSPLPLYDAIERALCESPATRSSWEQVKAAAAELGEGKSLYLPTLDATASYGVQHETDEVAADSALQSNFSKPTNMESLTLGWVLYDFGAREATLRNARQLLSAAQANQNLALQSALLNTATDYYSTQAAAAAVAAAARIEQDAQQTLDAATGRAKTGVSAITDRLQAQTAAAQATYVRVRAEGTYKTVLGKLAVDMSLHADEALKLQDLDESMLPDTQFVHAVHDLITDATQTHPAVLAAKAQWEASLESVRMVRAQGLPKLSLVGELSRTDGPLTTSLGQPEVPALTHDAYIGVTVDFPLFQGFGWVYKIRQAEATAQAQGEGLRATEQQVELGVWSSYQQLQTGTENLRNTKIILDSARESFAAAHRRYQSGVGNILEPLAAQTALATAEQEEIQAQLDWRTARLQLAASLGQLGMWAIR
jgi:outer membrane protein